MTKSLEEKLGRIANRINDRGKAFGNETLRLGFWVPVGIYLGGAAKRKYQKWFADKIGWDEKTLTTLNASIFGPLGSIERMTEGMILAYLKNPNFFQDLEKNFFSGLYDSAGLNLQTLFYSWAVFNFLQSTGRVIYSQKKGKSITSFSLSGIASNLAFYLFTSGNNFIKKNFNERKPAEGVEPSTYSSSGFL